MFDTQLPSWDGELCLSRYDQETETFFAIAVHSRTRGPATGGTRAAHYPSNSDAAVDAMRLSAAMTLKNVAARLPMGGGKSVIGLPAPRHEIDDQRWRRILEIHAENLAVLQGRYWTGPDVGTSADDMSVLHERAGNVFGRPESVGGSGSSGPATAVGVHVAIRTAAQEARLGDLAQRRVLVQGLGAVGLDLLKLLVEDGARVIATDTDEDRCRRARELGAEVVSPDEVLEIESDVFAPCAMGGVIDAGTARTIRTAAVAGGANNVLADDLAGDELANRGIVYAPDFVANGGGVIHLVGREVLGWSPEEVTAHVGGIAGTLREIFAKAREDGGSTDQAARDLVAQWLLASADTSQSTVGGVDGE